MCDSLSKIMTIIRLMFCVFRNLKAALIKVKIIIYLDLRKILIFFFSTPFSLKFIQYIIKYKDKYDIVHVFTPNPLPSILFAFIKSKKLIVTWGSDIINQKIIKFFLNHFNIYFLKKFLK